MGEDRRVNRNSSVIINSADNLKTQARKAGGRAAEKRGEREPSLVGGDKLASLGRPVRRRAGGNNQNEEGAREEGGRHENPANEKRFKRKSLSGSWVMFPSWKPSLLNLLSSGLFMKMLPACTFFPST